MPLLNTEPPVGLPPPLDKLAPWLGFLATVLSVALYNDAIPPGWPLKLAVVYLGVCAALHLGPPARAGLRRAFGPVVALAVLATTQAQAEQLALLNPGPRMAAVPVEAPVTLGVVALVSPSQHVEAGALAYVNLLNLGPVGVGPVLLMGASHSLQGLPGTTRMGAGFGARFAQGPWGLGGVAALVTTDPGQGGMAFSAGVFWALAVPVSGG